MSSPAVEQLSRLIWSRSFSVLDQQHSDRPPLTTTPIRPDSRKQRIISIGFHRYSETESSGFLRSSRTGSMVARNLLEDRLSSGLTRFQAACHRREQISMS